MVADKNKLELVYTDNLNYKVGQRYLLHNINWNIKKGERWVVFGLNGSGKTTLLSIIAGYNTFTEGRLEVFGAPYNDENIFENRKRIGFISSSFFDKYYRNETALEKLDELEQGISSLEENPYIGVQPGYRILRRQGYRVLILEKDLVFYKVDETDKTVTIYAVVDQRQDYLSIVRGL